MRVLDLFCCAGGATKGYQEAGHEVTGVDLERRPAYCGDAFFQGDAVEYAWAHASEFDFVHASPPCQGFSQITPQGARERHLNLIPGIREALAASGVPYVIENVIRAVKLGPMRKDLVLCGEMFGLRVVRHRVFEFGNGYCCPQSVHLKHNPGGTRGAGRPARGRNGESWYYYGVYGKGDGSVKEWQEAMGIDWMTQRHDLAEALPPAYTRYIGKFVE